MEVEIQDTYAIEDVYLETFRDASIVQLLNNLEETFVLSLPYGAIVWKEDTLLHEEPGRTITYVGNSDTISRFKSFRENCRYPVGMVLKGTLEVFNYHTAGSYNIRRRSANTLLTPGSLFGLFEVFGDLHGSWVISSGITSFFLTNSLGNSKFWGDNHMEVDALKHSKDSRYDHSILINDIDIATWSSKCILFDAQSIINTALKEYLYDRTIEQLAQLVRQNPECNFCDSEESKWKDEREIARTLDAMIEGYIPVYTLANEQDDKYLPYTELHARVKRYLTKAGKENESIDVWIPCLLGQSRNIGVYFSNIGNKFKKDHKQIQKTLLNQIAPLTYDTFIERTEGRSGYLDIIKNRQVLVWKTKNKKTVAILRAYQYDKISLKKHKDSDPPKKIHNIKELVNIFNGVRGEIKNWPSHLHSALGIELLDGSEMLGNFSDVFNRLR